MQKNQKHFHKNGYLILKNGVEIGTVNNLKKSINYGLEIFAQELQTTFDSYTSCTGRWAAPSRLFENAILPILNNELQTILEYNLGKPIALKKQNIICKNKYIAKLVPFHQDISYSYNDPYSFSFWLSLDDVIEGMGELIVLEGSHKWPIEPPVDFWSPFFKDNKWHSYNEQVKRIYLNAGDGLIFDSRLWHGSLENIKLANRYAYVTRWFFENYKAPEIPSPIYSEFGMWNCYDQTILKCKKFLQTEHVLSFKDAICALQNLLILHCASDLHNAGDLCGNIYKEVWLKFLRYIG
jgi:hypothetical protein